MVQVDCGFNTEVIVGMFFMRNVGIEIISVLVYISDLPYMTVIEVQVVIGDDLIYTFLCEFIDFSGLYLYDSSLLFGSVNLRMLRIYVYCPEQHIALLRKQVSDELEYTKNFIFIWKGDVWVEITWKDELVAFLNHEMIYQ